MCPQVRIQLMTRFGLEGIYIARCLGRGLGGTPSMRVRLCNHHQPTFPKPYNLLSRTRTTRTAAPPRKFRHTPAQPDPLLAQSTATGSPHSRWKFWKFAQLLEVHTATGSSGSLHSCWKFTQPLEVLEVCTAAGSSHSHWKFWKFAQPLEVLQASKG
jgi:hypothetical protein